MAWQGNGMGPAWERHTMCESAFKLKNAYDSPAFMWRTKSVRNSNVL